MGFRGFVVVIGFWVAVFLGGQALVQGAIRAGENDVKALPNTKGMGLEYAADVVLKRADFTNVTAHDASGRGRSIGDGKDWVVCEQYRPASGGGLERVEGRIRVGTTLNLGVVRLDEQCGPDLTLRQNADLSYPMPDYRGFPPAEVVKAMRKEASLRFYTLEGSSIDSRDHGKWRVCSQQLRAGATFYGQPVAFVAARYDTNVKTKGGVAVPNDLDAVCPDRGWEGVRGFPAERFPEMR